MLKVLVLVLEFKVTLYNVNYVDKNNIKILPINLTQEEQIIEYLKKNNKINRLIVESLLDVSKTRANDILNKMINDNILIQNGTGKNTYYVLKWNQIDFIYQIIN